MTTMNLPTKGKLTHMKIDQDGIEIEGNFSVDLEKCDAHNLHVKVGEHGRVRVIQGFSTLGIEIQSPSGEVRKVLSIPYEQLHDENVVDFPARAR